MKDKAAVGTALSVLWAIISSLMVCFVGLWLAMSYDSFGLRPVLGRLTVLGLQGAMTVLLIGLIFSWDEIKSITAAVSFRSRLGFLFIIFLGTILVGAVTPRTNRIYFDEHIYQNIAQTIAWTDTAFMCNECRAEYGDYRVGATEYNKQPNGHPFYLAQFYRVFGITETVAHAANNIAFLIGIFAVFGIGLLLFESELAALFAALFFTLTPMTVIWSGTTATEPSTAAFSALAVLGAVFYARRPAPSSLLLAVGAVSFAIYFRPESVLIVFVAAVAFLIFSGSELRKPRLYWGLSLFLLLALPMILHLYAVRDENWGSSGDKFALEMFFNNLSVNGLFYLRNLRYPLIFTCFFFIGLFYWRDWKRKIPIILWFLYSWGIFLFFYAGSYEYGADVRFSLVSAAPISLLAGLGASFVCSRLLLWRRVVFPVVLVLVFGLWIKFLPLIRAVGGEAAQARADIEYARKLAHYAPPDSIVLSHNPGMWLLWNRNAAQLSTATFNKPHVDNDLFVAYRGGVFFHWNYWCNVPDPPQNAFCNFMKEHYDLKLIKEYLDFGYHYSLYRVLKKDTEQGLEKDHSK